MNFGQFKNLVRTAVELGDTLDDVIPQFFNMAVRQIEGQHDFVDLQWWRRFTLQADEVPTIQIPPSYKRIDFLRVNFETREEEPPQWKRLDRVAGHRLANRKGWPDRFWVQGRQYVVIDAMPPKDIEAEILLYTFSEMPEEDEDSHWLLDVSPQTVFARVMLDLAAFQVKEAGSADWQIYQNQWEQGLEKLIEADNWNRDSGTVEEMEYSPDHLDEAWFYRMRGDNDAQ